MTASAPGRLVLVGTPIGNLGDITLRAVEALRSADRIAAEDTRRSRNLLTHLGITGKPLVSLDANASQRKLDALLEHIAQGECVAFVTDAGMPAVSDPGTALVRAARARGFEVTVVPGPSAVTTAVALSGLVDAAFFFMGFLPRQGPKRTTALDLVAGTPEPVVLFEAPNRTAATLAALAERMPARRAAVCRELTKLHEEVLCDELRTLAADEREYRGEIVIVLAPVEVSSAADQPSDEELDARIRRELEKGGSARDVADLLTDWSGRPRRAVYARVTAHKRG